MGVWLKTGVAIAIAHKQARKNRMVTFELQWIGLSRVAGIEGTL
jgi:hypothetical protein